MDVWRNTTSPFAPPREPAAERVSAAPARTAAVWLSVMTALRQSLNKWQELSNLPLDAFLALPGHGPVNIRTLNPAPPIRLEDSASWHAPIIHWASRRARAAEATGNSR